MHIMKKEKKEAASELWGKGKCAHIWIIQEG